MKVMNYSLPMEPIKLNQGRIADFGALSSNTADDYAPEYRLEAHVRPDSGQQPCRPLNGVQTEIADLTYVVTVILKTLGAKDDPASRRYLGDVLNNLSQGKVPHTPELTESSASVPDPLAAARARGRQYAAQEYESPDSLTLLDARNYAGRNERSINEERQQGKLYALLPAGKSRGFRYPKWQFDAEAARLHVALQPFVDAGSNCWTIHSFMMRKHSALDGKLPKDIVLDGSADIRRVVELANREINGEQGAA
jgi:hypothetical protein